MNAELVVRALYDQVAVGDIESVVELLDDNAIFVQAGSLPFGGEWRGATGFRDMAKRISAAWPGFAATPQDFFSNGDSKVAVLTSLTGNGLNMNMMELWTVFSNRITRCQPFYFDTAAAVQTAQDDRS